MQFFVPPYFSNKSLLFVCLNCTVGVWWHCYIGSHSWFQDDFWEASLLRFQTMQLLKDFVSWGSPGECSMIDHFLGDAFGVLSSKFWSTVLQSGALLPIHTLNCWTVQLVVSGFSLGVCLSVTLLIVVPCQSFVCFIRSAVTRCTLLMVLYLESMCQCGLHSVLWSHIGTLMHRLAAEHRSTAGLLYPSRCPSRTILLIRIRWCGTGGLQEQGQCIFLLA